MRHRVAELERANQRLNRQMLRADGPPHEDLLDNMNDIIYTTDVAGNILSVNQAVARVLGFEPRDVIGTHYGQWMPTEERDKVEAVRIEMLQGKSRTNYTVLTDKEGNPHHVEISVSPLRAAGRIVGTQGIIRDITHQRQAEQAVHESEERLRSLFNAVTESILLLDRQGTVLAMNETAARRFGKSPDELIGACIYAVGEALFPAALVAQRRRRIEEVVRTRRPVRFEDERAGRCLDTYAYPVCDRQGNVQQVALFSKDVTDQKKAEERVRTLQRQVEFILGAARTGLDIIDGQFNLRYVDAAWRRVYGDYEGRKCYEYFMGADSACPGCSIPLALAGREIVTRDGVLTREGNRPIQVTTIPFQAENGEWLVAEINVDIADRQRLELQLRESEERYRTVVESAGEAIAIVDAQGTFRFLNGTAARALGGAPADFVGCTMAELFPPPIAARQGQSVRRVIETGLGMNVVVPSVTGGQTRWYNTTIEPLKDSAGRVTSALIIARDVHELRTAQLELETYREKMIRAEHLASLGTLSAMLSHALTQPLTVIRLSVQNAMTTLAGAAPPPTVLEDLRDGLAEISTMATIIRRFRDFTGGTLDRTPDRVALDAVADKIIHLLEDSARAARITLRVERLHELPPIRTYRKDLEQVFFTLAQNAIEAADGRREHTFRMSGTRHEQQVELQFTDDCGGIPPAHLGRVFEPFFTTKPPGEGTGLGLCVVQRIISHLGGNLRMDSRWGDGTTFSITLPIVTPQE
ncbi:MAG: PAS domain-containing protein [Planctomycetes bacterium]|nr:PAS domain-containing protein [Planctomycetota bacterium]